MQGSAAFLLPAGRMRPFRVRPPWTMNAGILCADEDGARQESTAGRSAPGSLTYPITPACSNSEAKVTSPGQYALRSAPRRDLKHLTGSPLRGGGTHQPCCPPYRYRYRPPIPS